MPLTCTVETPGNLSQPEGMMANAALGGRPEFVMPGKKPARFTRAARLLRHADFERVYKQGRRHFSASMTVFYWERSEAAAEKLDKKREGTPSASPQGRSAPQGLRIGFTVGRALGGAVQRNRMKRRLREAVRMSRPLSGVAADVVINPKKSLLTTDFSTVLNEVSRAFAVIGQKLSQNLPDKTPTEPATNRIAGSWKPEAGSRS